ncbi:MAG: DUF5057 domain-containing protein, partial [Lachnospiraceae bacterium]|nr:DUF5057 domain-containing protein [Lachnospiraceae bacterium]
PDSQIYINGAPYVNGASGYDEHKYDNIDNKVLKYKIRIDSEKPGERYHLMLLIDANADGRYDEGTELLDAVSVSDVDTRETGSAANMALKAGHTYTVERSVPYHTGIIPWKLLVIALDESGNETGVRDAEMGMSAIKVKDKEQLYVLQITSDMDTYNTSSAYNWVYFPTDQEIYNNDGTRKHGAVTWGNSGTYFQNGDINGRWGDSQKKKSSKFLYYTSILEEYDVHFLRVDVDNYSGKSTGALTLKQIADDTSVLIGQVYEKISDGTYAWVDKKWADINMIILGYTDCYNDIAYRKSLDLLKKFIDAGKTILFTHDTISYMSYGTTGQPNGESSFVSDPAWKAVVSGKYYWGYNISKYYRDPLGLDRYGALINRGLLYDDNDDNDGVIPIGRMFWNALGNTGEYTNSSTAGVKDYGDIDLETAESYKLEYDIPFKPGTSMDLYDDNGIAVNTNLSNVNKTARVELPTGGKDEGNRIQVQGFINKIAMEAGNLETTQVSRTNSGQIVTYPFTIGSAPSYNISVAKTHTQYYQLNTEDDEIVVWYSIYQDNNQYQGLVNDGINNYYIYNKGNVTYSGVGHSGELTEEEYKLFVNTMIAAYQSAVKATKPIVTNGDRTAANDKDYIYVDYDASAVVNVNTDDCATEEEKNEKIKNELDKQNPIGDDVTPVTFTNAEGDEDTYFTKKVAFELENNSIVMNKVMTVHYYPVVYHDEPVYDDSGNPVMDPETGAQKVQTRRVVLYNCPLPLDTYRVKADGTSEKVTNKVAAADAWAPDMIVKDGTISAGPGVGIALKSGATEAEKEAFENALRATGVAFSYNVNLGKTDDFGGSTTLDNYEVVGVKPGQTIVEPLEEYYVNIPITDNYYRTLLPEVYYYYPEKKGYDEAAKKTGFDVTKMPECAGIDDDVLKDLMGRVDGSTGKLIGGQYIAKLDGSGATGSDYNREHFAINAQSEFEVEIQVVMRYGRDQSEYTPKVGTRGVVFMRRGMFSLD